MSQILLGNDAITSDETVGTNCGPFNPHDVEASSNGVSDRTRPLGRARPQKASGDIISWAPWCVRCEQDMGPQQDPPKPLNRDSMPKQQLQKPRRQPTQQRIHPCSEPGMQTSQPLILYCGADFVPRGQATHKSLYFAGHVHFARWLFAQRRGAVTPWANLIVSWREAKPCAMAIAAAQTGCCDGLRLDERRPQLRKCSGILNSGQLAKVAVSGTVVILADGERTPKVDNWVNRAASMTKLPFHVVCGNGVYLGNIVSSVAQGLRESHKRKHEQQLTQSNQHLVKPTDPVEPAAELPVKEVHAQLGYTSPRQMRSAYALANFSQAGAEGRMCFKAMPEPMYIELNPWFHDNSIICL